MIDRKSLLDLTFYKTDPFTGSDGNMRYRVEKIKDGNDELFQTTIWPGPYSYPRTDPARMTTHTEPFTEEGIQALTDWMNGQSPKYQDEVLGILDIDPYYPPKEEEE